MILTIILLTFALILYILRFKWQRRRVLHMLTKFEGPPTVPIFGNALQFTGSPLDAYRTLRKFVRHYEDRPFKLWGFHKSYVVVHSPEDIQKVANILKRGHQYDFLAEWQGDGLATSEPEKWKRHRRIINPIFNTAILSNNFMGTFNKHASHLVEVLKTEVGTGRMFDIWPFITKTAIDVIYESTMGCNLDGSQHDGFFEFRKNFEIGSLLVAKRFYTWWLHPKIFFDIYKLMKQCSDVFQKMTNFHFNVLQKRKQELRNYQKLNQGQHNEGKCMVDVLLKEQESNGLTDTELADETLTIIAAGMESHAVIESFTLLMLAMRQDIQLWRYKGNNAPLINTFIQDKVYSELTEVFGDSNRVPTMDDLSKLVFLEQCFKETLRTFSITPIIIRQSTEDIALSDDLVIPSGVDVIIALFGPHHNPDIYPNPDTWNPYNFDADKVASRPANSFIPFGVGKRMCIGYKYGIAAMKTVISTLLRNFKLTTTENRVEFCMDIKVRSANGYRVILNHRRDESVQ